MAAMEDSVRILPIYPVGNGKWHMVWKPAYEEPIYKEALRLLSIRGERTVADAIYSANLMRDSFNEYVLGLEPRPDSVLTKLRNTARDSRENESG